MAGDDLPFEIIPRRGEYMLLDKAEGYIASHTLFVTPSEKGKGILVSPTADGNIIVGPNANLVEEKSDTSVTYEGLDEIAEGARLIVPEINLKANITSFAGVRPTPSSGDFYIQASDKLDNFIHVAGIESPGLASSPAIGEYVVGILEKCGLELKPRENYISTPIQRIDVQGKIGLYLDRIIEAANSHQSHERVIFLEHTGGECFLEVRSILYAEVQDKDITLYTKKGAYILKRSALETLCKKVDSEYLLRCHKSFAVNINAVKEIAPAGRRNWTAVLENGLRCPVSQTYYLLIRAAYIENATR
jgi:hypothetical protein